MFFVPYVIFQPPMTVITRKIGPTIFLGTIVITWGAILVVRIIIAGVISGLTQSVGNGIHEGLGRDDGMSCTAWRARSR